VGDTSPPEVNSWRAEATTGTVTAQTLVDAVVVGIVAPARSDGSDAQLVSLDEEPATDDVSSAVAYPLDGLGWSVTDATTASAEPVTTVAWRHGERAVFGRFQQNPRRRAVDAYLVFGEATGLPTDSEACLGTSHETGPGAWRVPGDRDRLRSRWENDHSGYLGMGPAARLPR